MFLKLTRRFKYLQKAFDDVLDKVGMLNVLCCSAESLVQRSQWDIV